MRLLYLLLFGRILFGQDFFDPYKVHMLDIQFYDPDYDQILQDRWEIDDKTYEIANIIFNGDTLDSVGVRYKGNSTFWWTQAVGSPKFPLNIDLDLIHDDQDLLGCNKVKLSNSIFDATFVRESIGYLTQGYYLPTSEVGYMNVSVNGELLGLYVAVESVNKPFLTKHFGNNEGTFFKCEPQFHFGEPYFAFPDLRWYGTDSTTYEYVKGYELKSDTGWADLLDLIYTLNFGLDSIEAILNVDLVLWHFASSSVMPDLDSYTGLYMHNYYLYRNSLSGQFEIIPWDKDHTFGGAQINDILGMGGDVSWVYYWDPFLFENNSERPLFSQLMSVPLYKMIYTAHLRTIINDIYNTQFMQDLAYEMQDSIEIFAENDPNLFPSFGQGQYFRYNVDNYLITPDEAHWCGITSTVDARIEYLLGHEEISKTAPVISYVNQDNIEPNEGDDVIVQAVVTGASLVELMVSQTQSDPRFMSFPMFDDGEHDDGESNDFLFGGIIPFQDAGDHVRYFIRASNDDALVLSPQFAEREFYEYTIEHESLPGSTLVINEINYNGADDNDPGDWVELYNPTSEIIDIDNWVFKDENDDHVFSIPEGLSLAPDQYIVLCNDTVAFKAIFQDVPNIVGDLGFGLDGGGELVRLFDSIGTLMDTVHYDDSDSWPDLPDGNGPTLELIDPDEDNALGTNWAASEEYGSPGAVNTAFLSQKGQEWIPEKFQVYNNYPNPFNPRTTIHYDLAENGIVNITIYDMIGRQVVILTDDYQLAGYRSIQWNSVNDFGQPVPAGVYLYTVRGKGFSQTRKMLLLK